MIQYFKRWGYVLPFLLMAGKLFAQEQQYYIYIQNEKPQPFYVKYKNKVLSSSDRGYIIISELPAGSLPMVIGFPRNEVPEQPFNVRLGKTDQGFLLKQTDDKHFALYNLQTYSVTKTEVPEKEAPVEPATAETTPAQTPPPVNDTELVATQTPDPAPVAAAPAAEAPVPDTAGQAMMAAMRKDLDTALAGKAEITAASKPVPPKKQPSKFAEALDKVVSDDRPDDIAVEEPAAAPAAPVAGAVTAAGAATELLPDAKKGRRKKKDREPLTEEEQALLKDVMAQEQQAAQADSTVTAALPVADAPAPVVDSPAPAPVAKDTAVVAVESIPAPVVDTVATATASADPAAEEPKKTKKPKQKKEGEPEFIEFSTNGATPPATTPAEGTPAATETPAAIEERAAAIVDSATVAEKETKKKKRKLADITNAEERPNNIVTDSVDYSAPVRKEDKSAGLKMINSDCQNVMDDDTFRKLLRKFVAAKDDDGMIEVFRRNTRNYCLETAQIRRLAQLMTADEPRYRLLDMAYPKANDSSNYSSLSELLTDSYYQGRFKAMLHK